MGQKVNPKGLRVGIIKDWDSHWFAGKEDFPALIKEDHEIRQKVMKSLAEASISNVNIERTMGRVRVTIKTGKPGLVIGKGGKAVEDLRKDLEKATGKTVLINVEEIQSPDLDPQLTAERIALDLENRVSFRRAMKQAIQRTMRAGAKGIKTTCSGRLGGADMARIEHYSEGTIPLQTLRADIRYGFATAKTTYGAIGVKVWIYLGEVLPGMKEAEMPKPQQQQRRRSRRRPFDHGDRPGRGDRPQRSEDSRSRGPRANSNRDSRRGQGRPQDKSRDQE